MGGQGLPGAEPQQRPLHSALPGGGSHPHLGPGCFNPQEMEGARGPLTAQDQMDSQLCLPDLWKITNTSPQIIS